MGGEEEGGVDERKEETTLLARLALSDQLVASGRLSSRAL